jgi:hypothetical protein
MDNPARERASDERPAVKFEQRMPDIYLGPPYFQIHAEGWGLIAAALWLLVALPLILYFKG